MEFIGKTVKKEFKGFGTFTGVVQSYNESSGFFEIVYEDGDSEELDLYEVASLVKAESNGERGVESNQVFEKPRVGRKPKKRRRVENKVPLNESRANSHPGNSEVETLEDMDMMNSYRSVDLNESADQNLNESLERENGDWGDLKLNGNVEMKGRIDLNSGLGFNLNEDLSSDVGVDDGGKKNLKHRECIDLNLDANCFTEVTVNVNYSFKETRKRGCRFDLNLGAQEEAAKDRNDGNCEEPSTVDEEILGNGELKDVHVSEDWLLGSASGIHRDSGTLSKEADSHEDDLEEGFQEQVDGSLGNSNSIRKQARGRRKKRKSLVNIVSPAEKVLRRSARRGSAIDQMLSMETGLMNELPSSPSISVVTEDKPTRSGRKAPVVHTALPPKIQLPPSSQRLNLDGVAVLDVFSVYACLRSFSNLLFLSPFELEDFVAALNSKSPSSLFDCIHVSIMQTLRKHLEHLTTEGSESASECLRSFNWVFLDCITWPIFVVGYVLIHGAGLNFSFDLSSLKLFRSDYYNQPPSIKIEVLRCLCDDMIEGEAIRSEVNRRSLGSELDIDFDRGINVEGSKKRKTVTDLHGGSSSTEEVDDDSADRNFDECCLCKMDGSLICCDGCPAAYHSKCVGVVKDHLPEGDWFCPECAIDRNKPWMKTFKSSRGAELLGTDPHGRSYFCSCGYLLVLDSCGTEFSFNYYHRDDLHAVIDVLKTSDIFYGGIIKAIYKQWHISPGSKVTSNLELLRSFCPNLFVQGGVPVVGTERPPTASSNMCETKDGTTVEHEISGQLDVEVPKSVDLLDSVVKTDTPCMGDETAEIVSHDRNSQDQGYMDLPNQFETPGNAATLEDCSLISNGAVIKKEKTMKLAPSSPSPVRDMVSGETLKMQSGSGYTNSYGFAQTAFSVLEELMPKFSDKKNGEVLKTEEEIISIQVKAILKKSNKFQWPNIHHQYTSAQKEKCGWCFPCRYHNDDMDCLFDMNRGRLKCSKSELVSFQQKSKRKGHLIDVVFHILSTENRLRGLLLGPWLNSHYAKTWGKSVLKASDAASVKQSLLTLEGSLHCRALSADWLKPVDSDVAPGSATHVVTTSKHGIAKKRGRPSEFDVTATPTPPGVSICWWRGGQVSRQLFNWKGLPCSLVSKAAKQAGRVKIPGVFYSENSDYAKRSKCVAWRAAVESSTSIEQLAFQIRELDSNIKWDDIENTHPLPALDKESRKSIRLFKKCVVRRKALEGKEVKYLLDFGKRRSIPEIVMKNGTKVEESSSERKKYWLNESLVPLHLLRSFEEKRIDRKSGKMKSEKISETSKVVEKSEKLRGFAFLFKRAERSEYHRCEHCNKDVPIREAVCCKYCKGYFHKRHVKSSFGATVATCTYTCHRCHGGKSKIVAKSGKTETRKGKNKGYAKAVKSGTEGGETDAKSVNKQAALKSKKALRTNKSVSVKDNNKALSLRRSPRKKKKKAAAGVPLRRSSRKVKYVVVPKKKRGRPRKVDQIVKKKTPEKTKKGSTWQKKRTKAFHSYWLNGLRLSKKKNDERVLQFQRKRLYPPEDSAVIDQPKCPLCCEAIYKPSFDYISCELCEGWFHGDAYGINVRNKRKLIGFRCHGCTGKTPPLCPHKPATKREEASELVETECNNVAQSREKVNDDKSPENESDSSEDLQPSSAADQSLHEEDLGTGMDTTEVPPICDIELEDAKPVDDEMQDSES